MDKAVLIEEQNEVFIKESLRALSHSDISTGKYPEVKFLT